MKVLEKAILKDGTPIQLEDWSEHNTTEFPNLYGLQIGAYPIAQRTGKYRWIESGDRFRLTIDCNYYMNYTNENVLEDYRALINGEKSLQDLADHFWNGEKDKWYLGMETSYRP